MLSQIFVQIFVDLEFGFYVWYFFQFLAYVQFIANML